jgi:hypothetical protein
MNVAQQSTHTYYGKYAGTVVGINPETPWLLKLTVPDVLAYVESAWAEPCLPLSAGIGLESAFYFVPPLGAGVWVEFEYGDPNRPIWVGCRIASDRDAPKAAKSAKPLTQPIVIQTITQNKIILSSTPGEGIILETIAGKKGPSIVMTATSIKLSCGPNSSIELTPASVSINGTALVVT